MHEFTRRLIEQLKSDSLHGYFTDYVSGEGWTADYIEETYREAVEENVQDLLKFDRDPVNFIGDDVVCYRSLNVRDIPSFLKKMEDPNWTTGGAWTRSPEIFTGMYRGEIWLEAQIPLDSIDFVWTAEKNATFSIQESEVVVSGDVKMLAVRDSRNFKSLVEFEPPKIFSSGPYMPGF